MDTVVSSSVAHDTGNKAFWSHCSDGIAFRTCASYNTYGGAYGWDLGDTTNNITYDRCIAALVDYSPRWRGYRNAAFIHGVGDGNVATDCVATGVIGSEESSGFEWPEIDIHVLGVWTFTRNLAHNNWNDGIFTWQNTNNVHVVRDFVAYH